MSTVSIVTTVQRSTVAFVAVVSLIAGGCGGSDGSEDGDISVPPAPASLPVDADADPISVGELLDQEEQARPGDNVLVAGVLVDDGSGMRMCEALAESFPPQCGGRSIAIRNPAGVDADLMEDQGVRWSDRAVWLLGWVEDDMFVVS